jgi:uncharacterized membrane protein (DUF485 family)
MKLRLKTKDKIAEEKRAKKRTERERRNLISKFPRSKRDEANEMLDEMEGFHRKMNRYGILSFFFIGLFFLTVGTGYVRIHPLIWIPAIIGLGGFAFTIVETILYSHKANKQKQNFNLFYTEYSKKSKGGSR